METCCFHRFYDVLSITYSRVTNQYVYTTSGGFNDIELLDDEVRTLSDTVGIPSNSLPFPIMASLAIASDRSIL